MFETDAPAIRETHTEGVARGSMLSLKVKEKSPPSIHFRYLWLNGDGHVEKAGKISVCCEFHFSVTKFIEVHCLQLIKMDTERMRIIIL